VRVRVPPSAPCFLNVHVVFLVLSHFSVNSRDSLFWFDFGCTLAVLMIRKEDRISTQSLFAVVVVVMLAGRTPFAAGLPALSVSPDFLEAGPIVVPSPNGVSNAGVITITNEVLIASLQLTSNMQFLGQRWHVVVGYNDPKRSSTTIRIGPSREFSNERFSLSGSTRVSILFPSSILRVWNSPIRRRSRLPGLNPAKRKGPPQIRCRIALPHTV
jgi:hypothetical protein